MTMKLYKHTKQIFFLIMGKYKFYSFVLKSHYLKENIRYFIIFFPNPVKSSKLVPEGKKNEILLYY